MKKMVAITVLVLLSATVGWAARTVTMTYHSVQAQDAVMTVQLTSTLPPAGEAGTFRIAVGARVLDPSLNDMGRDTIEFDSTALSLTDGATPVLSPTQRVALTNIFRRSLRELRFKAVNETAE